MNEEEEKQLLSEAMKILGSRKTDRKAQAARTNGAKGGRPKKQPVEPQSDQPSSP